MFRWHTSAFIHRTSHPIILMKFCRTPRQKHNKEYLFFESAYSVSTAASSWHLTTLVFLVDICKSKDVCKCVYFEQSIYTDIFPNTFYRLWRVGVVFHTHVSHPRMLKNNNNQNTGPEFSCCHFFFCLFRIRIWGLIFPHFSSSTITVLLQHPVIKVWHYSQSFCRRNLINYIDI